jgi:hypothetical protein
MLRANRLGGEIRIGSVPDRSFIFVASGAPAKAATDLPWSCIAMWQRLHAPGLVCAGHTYPGRRAAVA